MRLHTLGKKRMVSYELNYVEVKYLANPCCQAGLIDWKVRENPFSHPHAAVERKCDKYSLSSGSCLFSPFFHKKCPHLTIALRTNPPHPRQDISWKSNPAISVPSKEVSFMMNGWCSLTPTHYVTWHTWKFPGNLELLSFRYLAVIHL